GTREELLDDDLERVRRALAAVIGRDGERLPAGLVELVPGLLEARRRLDGALFELAACAVAHRVQRPEDLAAELVGLVEHHRHLVRPARLEGRLAEELPEVELLEQEETDLTKIGLVSVLGGLGARHGGCLLPRRAGSRGASRSSALGGHESAT